MARSRLTGLRAWWVQRTSAICMLLFVLFLLWSFGFQPVADYAHWHEWMARPGITIAVFVFFVALLAHMWVGLRDVLLDYVRPASVRKGLLAAVALGLLGVGLWVLSILFRLHG